MSRTKEYTSTTGAPTSKTKERLGIPETSIIIWTPFHLAPEDNQKAKLFSKASTIDDNGDYQTAELFYAEVLRQYFFDNYEEITTKTEELLNQTIKTEDDLQKELDRVQRLTERLNNLLQKKKAEKEVADVTTQIAEKEALFATLTDDKEIKKTTKEIADLKTQLTTLQKN